MNATEKACVGYVNRGRYRYRGRITRARHIETRPDTNQAIARIPPPATKYFNVATKSTKTHKNVIFVSFVVHLGRVERFGREKAASRGIPLAARTPDAAAGAIASEIRNLTPET